MKSLEEDKGDDQIGLSNNEVSVKEAIKSGNVESILRFMVQRGLDLNQGIESTYPLHIAVENVSFIVQLILD